MLVHRPRAVRMHFSGRGRGQALAEFALIVPVFLLILMVAIDFGRLYFLYIGLNGAAREGAAFGANQPAYTSGIADRVKAELGLSPGDSSVTITVSCAAACASQPGNAAPNKITVKVSPTGGFRLLTPVVGGFFGGALSMSASATAVIQ